MVGDFKVVDGGETIKDREKFIDGRKEGRKGVETDVTTQHLKGVVREGGFLRREIRSEGAWILISLRYLHALGKEHYTGGFVGKGTGFGLGLLYFF